MTQMHITSVELHKKLGQTIDDAQREPVVVTKHGRPHAVIVSAAYFEQLQRAVRRARLTGSLTPAEAAAAEAAAVPSESEQRRFLLELEAALNPAPEAQPLS